MSPMVESRFAAIFLDFENIYYTLRQALPNDFDVLGSVTALLRGLRKEVNDSLGARPIIMKAYADFERLSEDVQRALFLTGFDPQYVLGTDHKNAADMRLCIDAIVTLYSRPDVGVFVVAAGDRDYIPMLNHLIERGKDVRVVAFAESLSGDLRTIVGEEAIFDANEYLSEATHEAIGEVRRQRELDAKAQRIREMEDRRRTVELQRPVAAVTETKSAPPPAEFEPNRSFDDPDMLDAIGILVNEYGHHPEVYLKPFLYRLSREFQWKAEFEIKELVQDLEVCGAIRVERRDTPEKSFSVILINYDHPQVRAAH